MSEIQKGTHGSGEKTFGALGQSCVDLLHESSLVVECSRMQEILPGEILFPLSGLPCQTILVLESCERALDQFE
jgi:hypothetical protein